MSILAKLGKLLLVCTLTAARMSLTVDTLLPTRFILSSFFLVLESLRWVEFTLGMNSLL